MTRASTVLAEIVRDAVPEVFKSYRFSFRETAATALDNVRACAASFQGSSANGLVQLAVEEDILAAIPTPLAKRKDLVNELTNLVAGRLEGELLRRGLAIRYSTPRSVFASSLQFFDRGGDGVVCYFEEGAGRVAIGIKLYLAAGAALESSPIRPLTNGAQPQPTIATGMPRPGSVLVVDDSVNARAEIVTALTGAGFEVLQAGSGLLALQLLEERADIRMVFADLHMTGMQGADLIRMIKADGRFPGVSIAVLTASPAAMAGVDTSQIVTCLIKPISPAAAISLTQRVMSRAS